MTVLSTSRHNTREANVQAISVDVLTPDAAILLLTENVPGAGVLTWQEWLRIAEWVGSLPLALDLLNRSFLFQAISARALLQKSSNFAPRTPQLDTLREALRGQVPSDAALGITEAFSISFEKLGEAARQLAFVLAQLGPTPIPQEFMDALPGELNDPGAKVALNSRHFVTFGDASSFGVMHQLMADFLRCITPTSQPFLTAIEALSTVMTHERCQDPLYWPLMNSCRPHAEDLFTRGVAADATVVEASLMGALAARLASEQGDYAGARRLEEQVLKAQMRLLGEEHRETLTAMNNLASILARQGDYARAQQLHERVLKARRRVVGEEHPDTLTSMNNLAQTLLQQGDYARAQQLYERVLEGLRRVLGEEHPDTLGSMSNLDNTLARQGDHAGARRFQERVVEARTRRETFRFAAQYPQR